MAQGFKDSKGKFHPIVNGKGLLMKSSTKKNLGIKMKKFVKPMVQTLVFDRDEFTESEAKKWAKSHGFRSTDVDIKENSIRLRQFSPTRIKQGRCATIPFGKNVKGVLCDVK